MGIVYGVEQAELARLYIYALALGAAFGALYDVFRIRRAAFRALDRGAAAFIWIFLEDIAFFIITAAATSIFFYRFNSGRIRLSGVAFIAAGFAVYYFTAGRLVMLAAELIIAAIRAVFAFILRLLRLALTPFIRLAGFIHSGITRLAERLRLSLYTARTLSRYAKLLKRQ